MSTAAARDDVLFENAPPTRVQRLLGLVRPDDLNIRNRALLYVLIGWAPLVLLSLVQDVAMRTGDVMSLLSQLGVHARYLVAVPLLVVAEVACAPQLGVIIRNFTASGIVTDADRGRFNRAVGSTRRLLRSSSAETVVIALAFLIALASALSYPFDELPAWAKSHGITPFLSPAGWWHTLVSLPLLLILILGWMWRLALWTRLLWLISRLDLRLVASHPDHCAGLGFVGQSVRAFAIVALALACIAAGKSAFLVMTEQGLPTSQLYFNIGFVLVLILVFVAPLFVFLPTLMDVFRRGTREYGALAERVGIVFESKWLHARKADQNVLDQPDFSATTDLYGIVANAYAIRFVPVDLTDLTAIFAAMLLPFVPVVLLAVPIEVIWEQVKKLLI